MLREEPKEVYFKDLRVGDLFEFQGERYEKTAPSTKLWAPVTNAVNLISDGAEVIDVNARVKVLKNKHEYETEEVVVPLVDDAQRVLANEEPDLSEFDELEDNLDEDDELYEH